MLSCKRKYRDISWSNYYYYLLWSVRTQKVVIPLITKLQEIRDQHRVLWWWWCCPGMKKLTNINFMLLHLIGYCIEINFRFWVLQDTNRNMSLATKDTNLFELTKLKVLKWLHYFPVTLKSNWYIEKINWSFSFFVTLKEIIKPVSI
jgi:hypothetical protein